jgi:hypothetical protein
VGQRNGVRKIEFLLQFKKRILVKIIWLWSQNEAESFKYCPCGLDNNSLSETQFLH